MRTLTYAIGAIILAAAAVFVWSRTALVPLEASSASTINIAAISSKAIAPISPTEMMINYKSPLPISAYECVSPEICD